MNEVLDMNDVPDEELGNQLLFIEATAKTLAAKGLMEGPTGITAKGVERYDALMATDWMPSRFVVKNILEFEYGVPESQSDAMSRLFIAESQEKGG